MRHFTSLLATLALVLTPLAFVGCDDDYEIADTLWGVWEGDMYVQSEWGGETYYSSYSVIQFDKAPMHDDSGTGYWVDYYSNAPWDYFASHIEWQVRDGRIAIYSYEDDVYYYIYDYSLTDGHFSGIIENAYGDPMEFYLRKTAAPDWGDFEWGWGYSQDWGWDYSTRSADEKPVRTIAPRDE